ncbi:unnamed protein product [Symbiodinium sp. KB8]|nr:unnamed protein product [Symbiodinium sp. KB8]
MSVALSEAYPAHSEVESANGHVDVETVDASGDEAAVLEYILQMKWYRGQTGTYTGEIGGAGVYGWSRLWQLRRLQRNLRQHREMWQLRQLQA